MTFVESRGHRSSSFDFPPLAKRSTFAGTTASAKDIISQPVTFDDFIYRRHFGSGPSLVKASSLNVKGMKYVLDQDELAEAGNEKGHKGYVVVVDTFTTGAMVAHRFYCAGYGIICLLSSNKLGHLLELMPDDINLQFAATIISEENESLDSLVGRILTSVDGEVSLVVAGAETGVELADSLSEHMGLVSNGSHFSKARRDKFTMGETVRAAGVRAVRQLKASTWSKVEAYLAEWNPDPFKVILKPVDSAGSDGVTLCKSMDDAKKAFGDIIGKVNALGIVNEQLLVQEYLEGTEYVVDMVSRDGEHKCVAVWEYDRRPVNGAGFVCFGQKLLTVGEEPRVAALIAYQKKVITALGIRYGPTHGEVKWHQGEPVLVEVGARCHGAEGFWMSVVDQTLGYNQVDATIDAYTNPAKFAAISPAPYKRKAWGGLKFLISYQDGKLREIMPSALNNLKTMRSYRGHQFFVEAGEDISRTQNCLSWAGCVKVVNEEESVFKLDCSRLEELESCAGEDGGFFRVDTFCKTREDAVVVIDPLSTGAHTACMLQKRGYKIVALYSLELDKLEQVKNFVPKGLQFSFDAVLALENDNFEQVIDKIRSYGWEIVEVMAGCETGVALCDELSAHLALPSSNGTKLTEARRNKYVMGEIVRASGVRAVKQLRSSTWSEVEEYIKEWNPSPFKVILKPTDSAGSDGVTLCTSLTQCREAFDDILGQTNVLGLVNRELLVQEYLEGTEYIVDMVSRDGEHKCVAVWEYDRRPVNGAGFVCFGQKLLTVGEEPRVAALIAYQKKVITALGIRYGPTHGEVKWHQGEPVLVEVGARCQGAEGFWMPVADAVHGYNQVSCGIDSYLSPDKFSDIPPEPVGRAAWGYVMFLVFYETGTVEAVDKNMMEELCSMKSFMNIELFCAEGDAVKPTTNALTWAGVVALSHEDLEILSADLKE